MHNLETKKFNQENYELDENLTKDIIIKSNKFNDYDSLIEVKLPNPYRMTEILGGQKFITFQIKSSYKSKFADYIKKNNKFSNSPLNEKNIKTNKTCKISLDNNKFDRNINFTNLGKQKFINKSLTNDNINK